MTSDAELSLRTDSEDPPAPSANIHQEYRNSHSMSTSSVNNVSLSTASEAGEESKTPFIRDPISHATSTPPIRSATFRFPRNETGYQRNSNYRRSVGSHNHVTRTRSLLQRLSTLSPDLRGALSPRPDRYTVIHELNDLPEDYETRHFDISFFEGAPSDFSYGNSRSNTGENGLSSSKKRETLVVGPDVGSVTDTVSSAPNVQVQLDPGVDELSRRASIREYGQKLAEETNRIVSVREVSHGVDLSSFEGLQQSPTNNLHPPTLKGTFSNLADLSYFYPTDPEKPDWKPVCLRHYYIAMLAIVSLVLAGVQEYLYQRSQQLEKKEGGLVRFNNVEDIPVSLFFCWKYLPTIVMVSYGVLWQIADYEVKRLEPYYQLSQPTGNIAAQSLNLDYVTLWAYFVPVRAFRYRHWVVFVSSLGTILATTVAPSLQNPSIDSMENPKCKGKTCVDAFRYFIRIQPVWSRLVTSCLILVAILAIILLFLLRRKSGLLSDPLGVAGIAAMATKSHILTDFDGMDEALHGEIHSKLQHRRYILYKSTIWQGEYTSTSTQTESETESPKKRFKTQSPHPIILRPISLIAFMVFMAICLPFIPAIAYTELNVIARKLPWLPILTATAIKQLWATLEFAIKMVEPFYTLSRGNAQPESTLTLDYQGTPYGFLPCKALLNRHYLVALVGLGSILGDILTVTLSSLSLTMETPDSFYSSSILSILIVLFLIILALLVYIRRRKPFMPRQPSTIASVLAFIHQSRMLDDFEGTERFTNSQMQEMLMAKNKRYALGWFKGRDNKPHCAIDEEPMLSRYVHGVSYLRAQAPWEENIV